MKILIADDHQLVIEAVKTKLADLELGIEFVLAKTVAELIAGAFDDLDRAAVDLNMPGADGHAHTDELRRRQPAAPIIVRSGYEDPAIMRTVLEHGALGFLPKAYSAEGMLSALPPGIVVGVPD
jgi:DNA-binding NarL/FixJ family response regulator